MTQFRHNQVPELYILDHDLKISSSYLTDKDVDRNIKNVVKLLGCCILYLYGIKKKNVYDQYSKDKLKQIFPDYPIKSLPKTNFSAKPEFKYVRQCKNHYMYVIEVGKSACSEYEKRFNKTHKLAEVIDWYFFNVPKVLPTVNKSLSYPIKILPLKYRKSVDIVENMCDYYRDKYRDVALDVYKMVSVPEWFKLTEGEVINQLDGITL